MSKDRKELIYARLTSVRERGLRKIWLLML